MLGILLAGVLDGEDFDPVRSYPIDQDVIGRDDRFAGVGYAAGAIHFGMVGQAFGHMREQIGVAQRGGWVAI